MPLDIPPDTTTSGEEFFRTEGAYTGLGAPIPGGRIDRWILGEGPHIDSDVELFDELCWRLLGDGVPLWRATLYMGTLHPLIRGVGARWLRELGVIEEFRILHGNEVTDEYLRSPIRATIERGTPIRRRLVEEAPEYPLLSKLRKAGATDYFALALNRTFRRFPVVTWTTDRPGGFSDADVARLEDINPALAAIVDARSVRRISGDLLDTYLGPQAGRRILAGQIRRAEGERLRAVIMMTDLRGFTALSDQLPGDEVIELLDDYFDAVATPIEERKGEILKFIGDGMLAIFPSAPGDAGACCRAALRAARLALAAMDTVNHERRAAKKDALHFGLALHIGDVSYGNIGAPHRLDFTVIGPAVNFASRLEEQTKLTGHSLLISQEFAVAAGEKLQPVGRLQLRDIVDPQEIFTLT